MDVDRRWYETFFEEDYLRLVVDRGRQDEEATLRQVDFVIDKLALEPPARILDLAGGHGRHAIPLAERGFRVTLLDLGGPSLAVARERAEQTGVELEHVDGVRLLRGRARRWPGSSSSPPAPSCRAAGS